MKSPAFCEMPRAVLSLYWVIRSSSPIGVIVLKIQPRIVCSGICDWTKRVDFVLRPAARKFTISSSVFFFCSAGLGRSVKEWRSAIKKKQLYFPEFCSSTKFFSAPK